jgi:hypothetical protein
VIMDVARRAQVHQVAFRILLKCDLRSTKLATRSE